MAESVVFVVDPVAFEAAFKSWNGSPVGSWMRVQLEQTRIRAALESPGPGKPPRNRTGWNYATGETEAGLLTTEHRSDTGSDLEGHVVAVSEHAHMLHEGTRPHVIRPRQVGHFLRFPTRSGKMVLARKVNHPGTMANPFLVRALQASIPGVSI